MPTHYGNPRRLLSALRRAVDDYAMIDDGDKICVGLSGGKDSLTLLSLLAELRQFYPKRFDLVAVHIDPAFYHAHFCEEDDALRSIEALQDFSESLEVPFRAVTTDIAEIVFSVRKEENPCSLCSRMRRGALHGAAKELGCNVLALGHHFDDAVETFMMNLFHEGRIGCFSPVTYLDRRDITVIRPMIYCPEKSIRYYVRHTEAFPIIESPCPADRDSERVRMKQLLYDLEKDYDGLKHRLFGAMTRHDVDGFAPRKNRSEAAPMKAPSKDNDPFDR